MGRYAGPVAAVLSGADPGRRLPAPLWQRQHPRAKKLYFGCRGYLEDYSPKYEGLDLDKLLAELEVCCREILESKEEFPRIEIVPDLIPEIHLEA